MSAIQPTAGISPVKQTNEQNNRKPSQMQKLKMQKLKVKSQVP
jgi:hypothetical protein